MKKLLLFFGIILTINCYSQISYEKGYYIDNSGQKTDCLIKNEDWVSSPINFKYRASENDEVKTIGIELVKEFGIYNVSKYVRAMVQVDLSSENIDDLSNDKNPVFEEQQLFLKVLIEGKANLYQGGSLMKYFYNVENSNIEQLIFKSYKNTDGEILINTQFRKQLWENLKCSTISMEKLFKLDYKKNDLINFFSEYNKCNNSDFTNYEEKQRRDAFNLTLRPRLNNSSLTIQNQISSLKNTDFGKKSSFGFGIEAEFILPFNKNKWALLIEPTYQSFTAEKTQEYSFLVAGPLKTEVNYTSIEIPLGVRHYFFLDNNSKIFINAAFVYDLNLDSTIEFKRADNSILSSLSFDNGSNFAFGIGYKLYDKFSVEMRYHTSRNNLSSYTAWSSDYKTISIILGYSIF